MSYEFLICGTSGFFVDLESYYLECSISTDGFSKGCFTVDEDKILYDLSVTILRVGLNQNQRTIG